jgi:hypothetical protein
MDPIAQLMSNWRQLLIRESNSSPNQLRAANLKDRTDQHSRLKWAEKSVERFSSIPDF